MTSLSAPRTTLAAQPMIRPMLMMKTQVKTGKDSFPTFCQLNLPNSGKYIAVDPYNSVVEFNDFFCLRQLNEGLRHC